MATVQDALMLFGRETGDHPPDALLAMSWLQSRYAMVLERAPWPFLLKETTFQTVPEITAGTVTVTLGSPTVTESLSNANGWSASVVGRYYRKDGDSEFYEITGYGDTNPDTLTLSRNYEGSSGTLQGYSITQRIYSLASDCREVVWMTVIDSPQPMERAGIGELDRAFTNRPQVGSPPSVWAPIGRDASDIMRIELYPIPDEAHGILYHYLQTTPTLTSGTTLMPQVNHALLRAGWLADYWAWRAAHDDAPAGALLASGTYEQAFNLRMQEMIIREVGNFPTTPMRLANRYRNAHQSKFATRRQTVTM